MMLFMTIRVVLLIISAVSMGLAPPSGPRGQASWPPALRVITSPAAAGSAQPQLSTSDRGLLLSWIEKSGERATLRYAERSSASGGWSAPRTVASGTDWFVNWADVPSVVRLADGSLVAHWLQKSGPGTYAYDVRLSYSRNDGATWSPSFTPHTDGTKTEHGFASLFDMPGGGLGLIWLDGRAMTPQSAHGGHGGSHGGTMSLRFATFSREWKQTAELLIDPRVCECCPTTAAVTADGPIAAFRNRTGDEVRDIYVTRFESGTWSQPRAVHHDGWRITACPVNGPMLAARGHDVAIAWFTAAGDHGRAWLAFSRDAGRTFGPPVRVDDNSALGRVDVELLSDGSAVASWIERAGDGAQFRVRRVEPSGARSAALIVSGLVGTRASGYPRIAAYGNELVFAWTESVKDRLHVRTAVARFSGDAQPSLAGPR